MQEIIICVNSRESSLVIYKISVLLFANSCELKIIIKVSVTKVYMLGIGYKTVKLQK